MLLNCNRQLSCLRMISLAGIPRSLRLDFCTAGPQEYAGSISQTTLTQTWSNKLWFQLNINKHWKSTILMKTRSLVYTRIKWNQNVDHSWQKQRNKTCRDDDNLEARTNASRSDKLRQNGSVLPNEGPWRNHGRAY